MWEIPVVGSADANLLRALVTAGPIAPISERSEMNRLALWSTNDINGVTTMASSEFPLITVGIPTFNRAPSLAVALHSALAQSYPHLEVVVSDNGSTDATETTCRALTQAEPRLRYLRQNVNRGATTNFQTVLEEARGEFFMWLGDDDWIESNYVDACAEQLMNNRTFELVSGGASYYHDEQLLFDGEALHLIDSDPSRRIISYLRVVEQNGVFYGLSRTASLRALLPMRSGLGEDILIVAKLAQRGAVLTIPTTRIHRSVDGVSSDLRQLALAEEWRISRFTRFSLAKRILTESATVSSPSNMGPAAGFALRIRCAAVLARRDIYPLIYSTSYRILQRLLPSDAFRVTRAVYRRSRIARPRIPKDRR